MAVPDPEPASDLRLRIRPLRAIRDRAMALRPENRYPSVDDLGSEVRALLDGLPVSAYRSPWTERLAQWAWRNRAAIGVILAYVVMRGALFALFHR